VQGSGTPVTQGKTTYSLAYAYAGSQPHAPTHIGTQTYSYDLDGNQNGWTDDGNGQRRSIVWDEENRIQSISDNGNEQDYKYDDAGQRVIKRTPKEETDYVNQFFTVRGDGQIGTKHVFIDTSRVVSKLVKSNAYEKDSYYFHTDQLSSTNYVTDSGGKLYEHLEYFPSGESWVEEKSNSQQNPGSNTSYQFSGKELDEETQLYYYGARYYDPRTAVWESPDPALAGNLAGLSGRGGSGTSVAAPSFLNAYDYADANPLTKTDADGRKATKPEKRPEVGTETQALVWNRAHGLPTDDPNFLVIPDKDLWTLNVKIGDYEADFRVPGWFEPMAYDILRNVGAAQPPKAASGGGDGAYNRRYERGSTTVASNHACGCALDYNNKENPYIQEDVTEHPELESKRYGKWGNDILLRQLQARYTVNGVKYLEVGAFYSKHPDPMHIGAVPGAAAHMDEILAHARSMPDLPSAGGPPVVITVIPPNSKSP
jgi:RHS repeat-associated protein